jgi:ABC-type enterochelin transport system permease subunit
LTEGARGRFGPSGELNLTMSAQVVWTVALCLPCAIDERMLPCRFGETACRLTGKTGTTGLLILLLILSNTTMSSKAFAAGIFSLASVMTGFPTFVQGITYFDSGMTPSRGSPKSSSMSAIDTDCSACARCGSK